MAPRDGICVYCHKPKYRVYPRDTAVWSCRCLAPPVRERHVEDTLPLDLFLRGPR